MIEISQQNMVALLTIAIKALVISGLLACIIVGPQVGSSPATSSAGEGRHVDYPANDLSPAADAAVVLHPEVRLLIGVQASPSGGNILSFSV